MDQEASLVELEVDPMVEVPPMAALASVEEPAVPQAQWEGAVGGWP